MASRALKRDALHFFFPCILTSSSPLVFRYPLAVIAVVEVPPPPSSLEASLGITQLGRDDYLPSLRLPLLLVAVVWCPWPNALRTATPVGQPFHPPAQPLLPSPTTTKPPVHHPSSIVYRFFFLLLLERQLFSVQPHSFGLLLLLSWFSSPSPNSLRCTDIDPVLSESF